MPGPRVVSLLASSTETVCALGCESMLVGRSHECDHPPSVRALPAVSAPRIATDATSGAIHRSVRARIEQATSVYRVDAEALAALRPDVILTQVQCRVCAVSVADVEDALSAWTGARPRVVSLEPNTRDDVRRDIMRIAEAIGVPERGEELVASLDARSDAIVRRVSDRHATASPRVAVIEWIEPLLIAGHWTPELVTLAGGEPLWGVAGGHAPPVSWEALRAADPDVIVVTPCGFDVARTRAEMPALASRPGWGALAAVRSGRVFLADGNAYFNRPGPRVVEALEIMAEVLHPDRVPPRHEGAGWERFATQASSWTPGLRVDRDRTLRAAREEGA